MLVTVYFLPNDIGSMRSIHPPTLLLLAAVLATPLQAQTQLSSLSEIQVGNLPEHQPRNLRTIYHQFNLAYALNDFRFGIRSEAFGSSESDRNYGEILQRFASYRRGRFQATLGHFYTIVGSGLLAHAFELPGVITEQRGSRRRYQIVRDLDGLQVRYGLPWGSLRLLRGTPVNSGLPPGLQGIDRRQGTIQGGSLELKPHRHLDTGLSLIHYEIGGRRETGAALNARLRLAPLLSALGIDGTYADIYGEYAQRDFSAARFLSLDRDLGRALYFSATLTAGAWGLSFEFKDYRDFVLGQINNPPTLIREHSAHLLNRITHDLLADDERGFQAELSYTSAGGQILTANLTRALRRLAPGNDDDKSLRELFLQLDSPLGESTEAQFFVDFNRNQILEDQQHRLFGTLWTWSMDPQHTFEFDAQFQDVDRRFGTSDYPYNNLYFNLVAHRAPGISAAIQLERSTDELATGADPSGTTWWWGLNLNADLLADHNLNLFAGQRRSGLACTAGTCYEVLGFEGVELRLHNRFF